MATWRVRLATLCSHDYGGTLQILPDSKLSYLEQEGLEKRTVYQI